MLDLFPIPPRLRIAARPLANLLHLDTLQLHIHEVFISFAVYSFIYSVISPYLSARLFPKRYPNFSRRTRLQWDMHVTSLVNSIFLSIAAPYVLWADQDRLNDTWEDRMWGYTGASGLIQGVGCGYFIWDVQVSIVNFDILGLVDLVHAVVALTVSTLGFRPFGLYYGIQYALIELSTPFVNIHWFLNKLDRAGSFLQIVNGFILIVTFGCCRLLWGSYMTFTFFGDVWTALHVQESSRTEYYISPTQKPLVLEHRAVWWVGLTFMVTHTIVMTLSVFWFTKMIATIKGRFVEANTTTRSEDEGANGHVKKN